MSEESTKESIPPKPKRKYAKKKWTRVFLRGIAAGLHVKDAAKKAGVDQSAPYVRRQADPIFAAAWHEAAYIGTDALEREAERRAHHGTLKPVFHKGEKIGVIREYSDNLLKFLLCGRKPKKYRDRKVETSVSGTITQEHTGTVQHEHKQILDTDDPVFKSLPVDERLRRLQEAIQKVDGN